MVDTVDDVMDMSCASSTRHITKRRIVRQTNKRCCPAGRGYWWNWHVSVPRTTKPGGCRKGAFPERRRGLYSKSANSEHNGVDTRRDPFCEVLQMPVLFVVVYGTRTCGHGTPLYSNALDWFAQRHKCEICSFFSGCQEQNHSIQHFFRSMCSKTPKKGHIVMKGTRLYLCCVVNRV